MTVFPNGRATLCDPCPNNIIVKEILPLRKHSDEYLPCVSEIESIGDSLFQTTDSDDQPGLSVEDRLFLSMMDREFHRSDNGQWIAPLPFKEPRRRLTDNRQ